GETAPFSKYENRGRRQANHTKRDIPPLNSRFWEFGESREGVKCQPKKMKWHTKRLAQEAAQHIQVQIPEQLAVASQ
ncbi:MAG: hypothetical protein WCK35_03615, partial [Chloroflexota bacterium]